VIFLVNLDDFFVIVCMCFHEGCGFHLIRCLLGFRPPLDRRIFVGKMKDFISYRIENYSCLWNGGLDHRKTVGKETST
jgi:hypothetical protein